MHWLLIYRYVLDITGIILLVLLYLYILTGYALVKPGIIEESTLGLISYRTAVAIHLDRALRILLLVCTTLHGLTGFSIVAQRLREKALRKAVTLLVHLSFTLVFMYMISIEYAIRPR
ncbi:MAG: hypothetical protein DRO13_01325 [Thermoprotei archaeon]|nr:MAG: hypothetical protein DRO13_01325 [Thermoprotei archaeon]